jgi:hypothetical protein
MIKTILVSIEDLQSAVMELVSLFANEGVRVRVKVTESNGFCHSHLQILILISSLN